MVETGDNGALEQALADAASNVCRASDPRFALDELAVSKRDRDLLCRQGEVSATSILRNDIFERTAGLLRDFLVVLGLELLAVRC